MMYWAPLVIFTLTLLSHMAMSSKSVTTSLTSESVSSKSEPRNLKMVGQFSCLGYCTVKDLGNLKRRGDPTYCFNHFMKHLARNKDDNLLVILASDGKFYQGKFHSSSYFRINKKLITSSVMESLDPWQHYTTIGYYRNFDIELAHAQEVRMPTDIKEIGAFLPAKDPEKPRVVVVTHKWGGGTTHFEDQMAASALFDFVFVRINPHPDKARYMQVNLMTNSSRSLYHTQWVEVSTPAIELIFDSVDMDGLIIHFIHPWPELMKYFTTLNKPMSYIMHDHHLITYDLNNDMHLTCGITKSFGLDNYKQPGENMGKKNISSAAIRNRDIGAKRAEPIEFLDRVPNGVRFNNLGHYKAWEQWRWDASELLRRCISVVTPSARNKQLFSVFFPEVYVSSAPLVRPKSAVCDVHTVVAPVSENEPLIVVLLGAISIGKGAQIAERVAYEGYMANKWKIYHVGGGFHSTAEVDSHILSVGRYKDEKDAMRIIDELSPHFIWFPAPRHESFCFVLDIVLTSKYPVVATTTGSFPERIAGRPNTWLLDGCLTSKEWIKFFNMYIEDPPVTQKRTSSRFKLPPNAGFSFLDHHLPASSNSCQSTPYDFYDINEFFASFRRFLDSYKSKITAVPAIRQSVISRLPDVRGTKRNVHEKNEWIEFLALNPQLLFQMGRVDRDAVEKELNTVGDSYAMVNRFSLDEIYFADRNPKWIVMDKEVGPPYTSNPDVDPETIAYNKLQWASPVSLIVVWNYLATNLDTYKTWFRTVMPSLSDGHVKAGAVKMTSSTSSWAIPMNVRKHTRAAVMLDPRYSEALFAVTMNVMYHLGDGWSVYIYCSKNAAVKYRIQFEEYDVSIIEIPDENLHSMFKVSKWLMDIDFWSQLTLAGIEHVLVYQADAILFTGHDVSVSSSTAPHVLSSSTGEAKANPTSKWYRSVNQYIEAGFDFIGAYGPGVGEDNRTPKLVGLNGGLSLRTVKAVVDCINRVSFDTVNEYRVKHGMHAVNHNPSKGIYMPEDIYYYHAMELLGYSLPNIDDQSHFAVQSAYHAPPANGHLLGDPSNDIYTGPLGIHGFDKGWYLTTAQLLSLMDWK